MWVFDEDGNGNWGGGSRTVGHDVAGREGNFGVLEAGSDPYWTFVYVLSLISAC